MWGLLSLDNPDLDAHFFVLNADSNVLTVNIQRYVPHKSKSKDTINLRCCLENVYKGIDKHDTHYCPYKINENYKELMPINCEYRHNPRKNCIFVAWFNKI